MQNKSVTGERVMVVSPHHLASEVGAGILRIGGNAFDAAVAVSACLAVVYPHMTGLGGDSFWLVYSAEEGKVRAYNGSGRSGHQVSGKSFIGQDHIPSRGVKSVITVPGMVDSWAEMIHAYGRLTLAEVLQPAIAYAEQGFPCSRSQSAFTAEHKTLLLRSVETGDIFVPSGHVPDMGEIFVQKKLANSLKLIAAEGRDAFYKGTLGQKITQSLQEQGGLLTFEDFADHKGDWVEPISVGYRGYDMYQVPPNSQGFSSLMALNILELYDVSAIEHGSFEYYHIMIEALKLAFQDRNRHLTDPDFHHIPLQLLLSKEYARQLSQNISMGECVSLEPLSMGSDTAYAAVMDDEGNAVSFIQSLYFEFGSSVMMPNTGILLQNRGSFFSLDPRHVNCLEPRKRTFHTLMPAMACLDGKPSILYGTQGGEGQPQVQTAIITRMIDYDMDPQQAINHPRWLWGRSWGEVTQDLRVEARMNPKVMEQLRQVGHLLKVTSDYDGVLGHAQAIRVKDGSLQGGADPRADGRAVGW